MKIAGKQILPIWVGGAGRLDPPYSDNRCRKGRNLGGSGISEAAPFLFVLPAAGLWPKEVVRIDPSLGRSQFDRFCPVRNVTRDYPPTLLRHGDRDTDVPFEQSPEMALELKRVGVEHDLIPISEGHGFDGKADDPQTIKAFERVVGFLDKHLKKP